MDREIVLRFMELYGKHPTWREYLQYLFFNRRELTYEDYRLLTASPF